MPNVSNELVRFLNARIAEDITAALASSPGPWHVNAESDEVLAVDDVTVAEGFALAGSQLRATTDHIARYDPSRALREAEAKRKIVRRHFKRRSPDWDRPGHIGFECAQCTNEYPCPTLAMLAEVYADHPDYLKEWRP